MANAIIAQISGLIPSDARDFLTTPAVGPVFTVRGPKSLRFGSAGVASEFGAHSGAFSTYGGTIANFVIVAPIEMDTYWSQDGYVAVSRQFENIIGFGDTSRSACNDALNHLIHLREEYGSLRDEEGTREALKLRDRLSLCLKAVGN